MINEVLYDKYLGALMGAAVGDALGWPNEGRSNSIKINIPNRKFIDWEKKGGGKYWPYLEQIKAGEYSDDTQLIFSVARSLMRQDQWNKYFVRLELPAWMDYERGGGGATKRAAGKWANNICPWERDKNPAKDWQSYFNAGGNGVAMRILPIVLYHIGDENMIYKKIFINGIGTHGHPRALIGALLYGKALEYLLQKENTLEYGELIVHLLNTSNKWGAFPDPSLSESWLNNASMAVDIKSVWQKTVIECIDMLNIVNERISNGVLDFPADTYQSLGTIGEYQGSGTVSAVSAIYIASKYAATPEKGITEAAFLYGADTDTVASMVGGLMGALYGTACITNTWYEVQDADYIKTLSKNMYNRDALEDQILFIPEKNNTLKKKLRKTWIGDSISFPIFGHIKVIDCTEISTLNRNSIIEYKLNTELGQTVYVKQFSKNTVQNIEIESFDRQELNKGIYSSIPQNADAAVCTVKEEAGWQLTENELNSIIPLLKKSVPAGELLNAIINVKNQLRHNENSGTDEMYLQLKSQLGYKWLNKKLFERLVAILIFYKA